LTIIANNNTTGRDQLQTIIDMQNTGYFWVVNSNSVVNYDDGMNGTFTINAGFNAWEATGYFWPDILFMFNSISVRRNLVKGNLRPPAFTLPAAWLYQNDGFTPRSPVHRAELNPDDPEVGFNPWINTEANGGEEEPNIGNYNRLVINGIDVLRGHWQYSQNGTSWADISVAGGSDFEMGGGLYTTPIRFNTHGPQGNDNNFYRLEYRFADNPTCMPRAGAPAQIQVLSGEAIGEISVLAGICGLTTTITRLILT
jgi:hypothetical protein